MNHNNYSQLQEVNDTVLKSIRTGVMDDDPPYRKLFKWVLLSGCLMVILILSINLFFVRYLQKENEQVANESSYYFEVESLYFKQKERLNLFGIVDREQSIFHVPIDSAYKLVIEDYEK